MRRPDRCPHAFLRQRHGICGRCTSRLFLWNPYANPPLGTLIKDEENDWLISDAFNIAAFNNTPCEFLIEGYETDPHPQDFSDAISNFITLSSAR
jgi:hypothetical protein